MSCSSATSSPARTQPVGASADDDASSLVAVAAAHVTFADDDQWRNIEPSVDWVDGVYAGFLLKSVRR